MGSANSGDSTDGAVRTSAPPDESSGGSWLGRVRDRLEAEFFPAATPIRGRQVWVIAAASTVFAVGAFTLLLGWRAYPSALNVIWAEDGAVFLPNALHEPWLSTLFSPYAGYMHLVPRLIAEMVALVPVGDWPLALALASIAVRIGVALFVWHAMSGHVPSGLARAAVGVVVITIPLGAGEVLNNIANLHWFLVFATVPALLWRPSTWVGRGFQLSVVVLAVLSDPITLLWFPIVVLRFFCVRSLREQLVSVMFAAAGLIQVFVVLQTSRPRGVGLTLFEMSKSWVIRTAQPAFIGVHFTESLYESAKAAGILVTIAALLLIFVPALIPSGPQRGLILCYLGTGFVFYGFVSQYSMSPDGSLSSAVIDIHAYGRYGMLAGLLLLSAVVVASWTLLHYYRRFRLLIGCLIAGVAALYVVGVASGYGYRDGGLTGPTWADRIIVGQEQCRKSGQEDISLPVDPPGWQVLVPCKTLP